MRALWKDISVGTSTHTDSQNIGTSLLYCLIADVFRVQGEANEITEITGITKYTTKIIEILGNFSKKICVFK